MLRWYWLGQVRCRATAGRLGINRARQLSGLDDSNEPDSCKNSLTESRCLSPFSQEFFDQLLVVGHDGRLLTGLVGNVL